MPSEREVSSLVSRSLDESLRERMARLGVTHRGDGSASASAGGATVPVGADGRKRLLRGTASWSSGIGVGAGESARSPRGSGTGASLGFSGGSGGGSGGGGGGASSSMNNTFIVQEVLGNLNDSLASMKVTAQPTEENRASRRMSISRRLSRGVGRLMASEGAGGAGVGVGAGAGADAIAAAAELESAEALGASPAAARAAAAAAAEESRASRRRTIAHRLSQVNVDASGGAGGGVGAGGADAGAARHRRRTIAERLAEKRVASRSVGGVGGGVVFDRRVSRASNGGEAGEEEVRLSRVGSAVSDLTAGSRDTVERWADGGFENDNGDEKRGSALRSRSFRGLDHGIDRRTSPVSEFLLREVWRRYWCLIKLEL